MTSSADDLDLWSRSKVKVKFSQKWVMIQRAGPILEAISPTDFIFGTKVQPNNDPSTDDLDQRSRSKVKVKFSQKMVKKPKTWSYLGGYFTYRLHTWYQDTTQ